MPVDAITLAAIADEWRVLLTGARIDTIIQPTEYSLALQCYAPARQIGSDSAGAERTGGQNRWLYLSAHSQLARAHLTALKPPKVASEPPPFVMLLRKHLEGARIESIGQSRWERVLEIVASYRGEDEKRVRFRLIVEIMGRMSNIILCNEDGLILGSIKRVGADVNRYRVIAAGVQYVPPPPQQRIFAGQSLPRLEPTTVTASQLSLGAADAITSEPEVSSTGKARKRSAEPLKLWQVLTKHLLGFSPQLARECVYRTTENTETPVEQDAGTTEAIWEELAWNVRDVCTSYDTNRWQPQLAERIEDKRKGEAQGSPIAFAPYALEQYAQVPDIRIRHSPSMNVLLDDYYARTEWHDAMEGVRAPLRKLLQTQRDRCLRKADNLQQELAASEEAARFRSQAELLLAYQNEIQQGQVSVTLPDFATDTSDMPNALLTIPLDPRFDAVGNANRLFNKYHKLRRAIALVPDQIEQNTVELATLEQLLTDLTLAETPPEVALVKAEVQAAGYIRGKAILQDKKAQMAARKAAKKGKSGKQNKGKPVPPGGGVPLHLQSRDGFTILIGKNSRQNEDVTFHQATSNDMWLHARGVPGSHVIIKAAGRTIPHSTIEQAARLAAYYSQARGSTSVPIDYTLQRHVRHMKGGGPGMVIYERERTLYAEPDGVVALVK